LQDTSGDSMASLGNPWRRRHRDDRRAEKGLIHVRRDQVVALALTQEDERELADLRERESDDDGGRHAVAEKSDGQRAEHRFADQDERQKRGDQDWLAQQDSRVEQHSDRDEKEREESLVKRSDVRHRLMSVIRLGDDQSRQKRSERRGKPRGGGRER